MKFRVVCLCAASVLFLAASGFGGVECSGPYTPLPNYRPGSGGPCAAIGLDTHKAVCEPGKRYATYCDDAKGGFRTCQSDIPCARQDRYSNDDRYDGPRYDDRDRYYDRRYDDRDRYDDRTRDRY